MTDRSPRFAFLVCCLSVVWSATPSLASAQEDDGVYGRFDHGLVLSPGAGVSLGQQVGFVGELRARVLDTAGPALSVRAAPGRDPQLLATIELRPFFPALFLLDLWTGNPWVDTLVQSIGVELGAAFFPGRRGAAFAYGFSLEVPVVLSRPGAFDGLGLRLAARRIAPSEGFLRGPETSQAEWNFVATLSVHLGVRFSPSYAGPPGYRPRSTSR